MTALAEADDLLAAELAFGLLDADKAAAARGHAASEPQLAARLATWERLAATLRGQEDDPPRPSLWQDIAARLPGNDDPPDGWALAARWRAASIALGVLAAVLGALALHPASRPATATSAPAQATAPPLVAVLRGTGAAGAVAVTFEPGSDRLTLAADALDPQAGSAELWAIAGDAAPRSLGLIPIVAPNSRTSREASRLIAPGVVLAVTLEPSGGSPTGKPSGTPLLTGTVAAASPAEARPAG